MYAAILGIAGLGLAADRFILGSPLMGPAGAEAGITPADAYAVPPTAVAAAGAVQLPSDLAQRLEALRGRAAPDASMASVLTIPSAWFEGESGLQQPEPVAEEPAQPVREYKLTAITAGKDRHGGYAVVNKRQLSIGESIDGMKLIEIRGRQAIFEAGSEKVVLTMELPMKETRPEPGPGDPRQ